MAITQAGKPLVEKLYRSFEQAQAQAKAANEARYKQILEGFGQRQQGYALQQKAMNEAYNQRWQRGLSYLTDAGEEERAAIADRYAMESSRAEQSAIGRGLHNTTVLDTLRRGVLFDRMKAELALAGQLRQQRLATDMGLSGEALRARQFGVDRGDEIFQEKLGTIERRTDAYPDPALLANLALQLGAVGPDVMVAGASAGGYALGGFSSPPPRGSSYGGGYYGSNYQPPASFTQPGYSSGGYTVTPTFSPTTVASSVGLGALAGFSGGLAGLGALAPYFSGGGQSLYLQPYADYSQNQYAPVEGLSSGGRPE